MLPQAISHGRCGSDRSTGRAGQPYGPREVPHDQIVFLRHPDTGNF